MPFTLSTAAQSNMFIKTAGYDLSLLAPHYSHPHRQMRMSPLPAASPDRWPCIPGRSRRSEQSSSRKVLCLDCEAALPLHSEYFAGTPSASCWRPCRCPCRLLCRRCRSCWPPCRRYRPSRRLPSCPSSALDILTSNVQICRN